MRPDYPMLRPNGSSPPTEVALVVNNAAGRGAICCTRHAFYDRDS